MHIVVAREVQQRRRISDAYPPLVAIIGGLRLRPTRPTLVSDGYTSAGSKAPPALTHRP